MSTSAEEIRARVRRVDEERIAARADAATRVHEFAAERDAQAARLAQLEQDLAAAVAQAGTVMTLEELALFSGRTPREVKAWFGEGRPGRRSGVAGSEGRRGRRSGRVSRSRSGDEQPGSATPVAGEAGTGMAVGEVLMTGSAVSAGMDGASTAASEAE